MEIMIKDVLKNDLESDMKAFCERIDEIQQLYMEI
jgi:hypothetical protein